MSIFRKRAPITYDMDLEHLKQKRNPPIEEETITISIKEYDKLKEQSTCGCGICLAHNGWECPKMKDTDRTEKPIASITTFR